MNDIWEEVKQSIDPETERVFLLVLGALFSTCFFVGLTFNVAALCFFSKRSTKLKFKVMFRAAACVDISICFLSMFIAISFFQERRPAVFSNEAFCQIWGFLWSFAAKFSVSIVSISSLMRLINIYHPHLLKKTLMNVIITVDAMILLTLESLHFLYGEKYNYVGALAACVPDMVMKNIGPFSLRSLTLSYVPLLSYLLPFPVILCCYFISSYKLVQQRKQSGHTLKQARKSFHAQAIMTVSSFMGLYLLLQAPLAVYIAWMRIRFFSGATISEALGSPWNLPYIPSVVYLLIISLNATINPIVYYSRLQGVRNFVQNIFLDLCRINQHVERRAVLLEHTVGPAIETTMGTAYQPLSVTCPVSKASVSEEPEEETFYETYI